MSVITPTPNGMNYAVKFAPKVDERFTRESQAAMAVNNDYSFKGVKTVEVYSIPTKPMTDYNRTGEGNRYGPPTNLGNNVQELTLTRDRAFTYVIDRGDRNETQLIMDAGKSLSRQTREVLIPEYDTYVFWTLAKAACANSGHSDNTALTKAAGNAYEKFLHGQEVLGNANVPDSGRICFASYRFANLLKMDPSFMIASERSRRDVGRGVIGEVDGVRIVKVPAVRLPNGCDFILTHPVTATAPKTLEDFKIHNNPPGISGWLVEGRIIYDCFILNSKKDAIYYHGTSVTGDFAYPDSSVNGTGLVPSGG